MTVGLLLAAGEGRRFGGPKALARDDDDFRLLVDRALSQLYPTNGFRDLYKKWIGDFDQATQTFFLWSTPAQ